MKVERRECSVIGQATQWPASMSLFGVHLGSEQKSTGCGACDGAAVSIIHRQKAGGGIVAVTSGYTCYTCYTVNVYLSCHLRLSIVNALTTLIETSPHYYSTRLEHT